MKTIILFLLSVPVLYLSQIRTGTFSGLETLKGDHLKPVVIHVYTDWCAICKIGFSRLNKNKKLVELLNENYYVINFEAEKTKEKIRFGNREFEYLPNGNSGIHELALALSGNKDQPVYPLWVFLDKDLNLVYYHEGLFRPEDMMRKLLEILSVTGQPQTHK